MNTFDLINKAARARQANWNAHPATDPQVSFDCTSHLTELWSDFRRERAQERYGARGDIVKQARVERELERLMTRNEHIGS